MTAGYFFSLDCARCGGPLEHRANGTTTGLTTRAVAHCPHCRDDWLIEVTIRSEKKRRGIEQAFDAYPMFHPQDECPSFTEIGGSSTGTPQTLTSTVDV